MTIRIGEETAARVAAAWPEILARIAMGERIRAACEAFSLTPEHVWAYRVNDPTLRAEWESARKASADAFLERILEIVDTGATTARDAAGQMVTRPLDHAYARVTVDSLKWAAAKRNPDHYSDRQNVNVQHSVDIRPAIEQAAERARLMRQWYAERALTLSPDAVSVVPDARAGAEREGTPLPPLAFHPGQGGVHTPENVAQPPERGGREASRVENTQKKLQDLF